jgi:TonB family protein
MPIINCPECGGRVSTDAAACPHCGFPSPARNAAPPVTPARGGVSAGWLIFGFLAVGALMLGLLGWGVYRVVQRVDHATRRPEELVDFVDSAETSTRRGAVGDSVPATPSPPAADDPSATAPPAPPAPAWQTAPDADLASDDEKRGYELSAVEVQPELLNRGEVAAAMSRNYPPLLRDAGVTGTVTIRMRIGRDGLVQPSTIHVESSTHEAFSDAAVRVAQRLRFSPARIKGQPVPVWVMLPITFQLES